MACYHIQINLEATSLIEDEKSTEDTETKIEILKYVRFISEVVFMLVIGFLTAYPFILFLTNYLL